MSEKNDPNTGLRVSTGLLCATVVFASAVMLGSFGIPLGVFILCWVVLFRIPPSMWTCGYSSLWPIVVVVSLIFVLMPGIMDGPGPSRRAACRSNVTQVMIGLQRYEADHGHFPPAYVTDADGKPMHSWRVLILPYIEQQELYEKYDFNEPWDGPNNRQLAGCFVPEYACPEEDIEIDGSAMTSYVAVVGPNTAWPGSTATSIIDIDDGANNTIMIVEVSGAGINWMEPRDLTFEQARQGIHGDPGLQIASRHIDNGLYYDTNSPRAHVGMADGSVHLLPGGTPPEIIEAMLTINGGEEIPWDDRPQWDRMTKRPLLWIRRIATVVLAVSVLVLLLRPRREYPDPFPKRPARPRDCLDGEP